MGLMTYADFTDELDFLLGRRTDTDAVDTSRVSRWINQAYTYMCHPSVHKFREMQAIDNTTTLVSGTNEYTIASLTSITVVAIRWITYIDATSYTALADKRRIKPRGIRWFESRTLSSGRPYLYSIDGSSLFLSGVPGSNEASKLLRIGFYREPTVLSGTTTTVLTSYYDRPLVKFAEAFAEADLGDKAKALITLKEAVGLVNNAIDETELEEDDGSAVEFVLQPAMGF